MFNLHTPGIYELINKNKITCKSEVLEQFKKRDVVIISIIGSCHFHDKKGYKRAFRLVIDAFGSPTLFQGDDEDDDNKKDSQESNNTRRPDQDLKHNNIIESNNSKTVQDKNHEESQSEKTSNVNEDRTNKTLKSSDNTNGKELKNNIDLSSSKSINKNDEDGTTSHKTEKKKENDEQILGDIEGFYTDEEGIIFLHVHGDQDQKAFLTEWQKICNSNNPENQGFPEIWASIKSKYIRSLLLIFSLSHVVLISNTVGYFDTSYIHTFRIVDTVRNEVLPFVSRALGEIEGIPKVWRDHARICSPRILFLFECMNEYPRKVSRVIPDRKNPVKEQQYRLEEEIYHILRKCRIVTNISANSLFAIPSTEEYVFVYDVGVEKPETRDAPENIPFNLVNSFCQKRIETMSEPAPSFSMQTKSSTTLMSSSPSSSSSSTTAIPTTTTTTNSSSTSNVPTPLCDMPRTYSDILYDFREFIVAHSRLAHESGFDDDSKRVAEHKHFFVLPTFRSWVKAFRVLSDYFIRDIHSDHSAKKALLYVDQLTSIDLEYLESQCAKIFPKVFAHYLKNLPEIYPEKVHQSKLAAAINVLLKVSHGPGVSKWIETLRKKCDAYWKNGRQQCEARSLKENSCRLALHRFKLEDHLEVLPMPQMDDKLPVKPHCTGRKYISYCNCGKSQAAREEPFTIRDANFTFYERIGQQNGCCIKCESIEFPYFQPPSPEYKIDTQEMLLRIQTRQRAGNYVINNNNNNYYNSNQVPSSQDGLEDELRQESSLDSLDEYEDSQDPDKVNDIKGDAKSGIEEISSEEEEEEELENVHEDDDNNEDDDGDMNVEEEEDNNNPENKNRKEKTKETLIAKWEAGLKQKSGEGVQSKTSQEKPSTTTTNSSRSSSRNRTKENSISEDNKKDSQNTKIMTKKEKSENKQQQQQDKTEETDVDQEIKSLMDKLLLNEKTSTHQTSESPAPVKQVMKRGKGAEGSRPTSSSIPGSPTNEVCDEEEDDTQDKQEVINSTIVEFLPGMLHSKSIPGLLPLFSSWSLVCLGSSSLYCHQTGITHQPGFLNGSSTLLPWDRLVKAEAGVSKPIPRLIRGRRPSTRVKRISDEFTVKIFMGMEFECKRGHRFVLEAPDKILQIQGQTPNLKEAANLVATSDIPLYFPCPCRDRDNREAGTVIAQLMRVHIVTPKAPVHVTVNPRVQPGPPPCPIFFPGISEPIKLTPSSYWVLRLPYSYVSDEQIFIPSTDVSNYNGKLLRGVVDVHAMNSSEVKQWNLEA